MSRLKFHGSERVTTRLMRFRFLKCNALYTSRTITVIEAALIALAGTT
jgi:hypothetical protein